MSEPITVTAVGSAKITYGGYTLCPGPFVAPDGTIFDITPGVQMEPFPAHIGVLRDESAADEPIHTTATIP